MATVTQVSNPGTYSPIYNYVVGIVDSASSSVADFKYIYNTLKVDMATGITSSLGTNETVPKPVTGTGRLSMSSLLGAETSFDCKPFITSPYGASNSIVKYFYNYGYSHTLAAEFIDVVTIFTTNAWLGFNTFTPYDIQVGDIINISMDNQSVNPQYNGVTTVLGVTTSFGFQYVQIDKTYVVAPITAESGEITTITRPIIGTSSIYYAFNGTRQYDQPLSDSRYNWSNTHTFYPNIHMVKALTNYKSGLTAGNPIIGPSGSNTKKIFRNQFETLDIMVDDPTQFYQVTYNNYNSNQQITSTNSYPLQSIAPVTSFGGWKRYILPVGTTGSQTYFTQSGPYYSVKIDWLQGDEPPFTVRNKMIHYYEVVGSCTPGFTNYRLTWMNPHGGFDYWNFNFKSTENQNVTKNEYRKLIDYDWTIGDTGDDIYSVKANKSYTVTTDYLDDYDFKFLNELVRSKKAFLVDEANRNIYPIIIDVPGWLFDRNPGDFELFGTVTFRMAYDIIVQRG